MAASKTARKPAEKKHQAAPSLSVRIDRLVDSENTPVRALASVNIGNAFAIHGIRVIDSQKGLFVAMPQSSYQDRNGNTKYSDLFHPVTAEARTELNNAVLDAYEAKPAEDEAQAQDRGEQDESEVSAVGQTM